LAHRLFNIPYICAVKTVSNHKSTPTVIQRIQTVYLIFAILLTLATLLTPLFDQLLADPAAWILSGFIAAIGFSIVLSGWGIMRFKDRTAQASTVGKAMIFQLIAFGVSVAVVFTPGAIENVVTFASGSALLFFALVLQLLARAAIIKDEKLVKSMDRIR
jgi:hypothetical protein